MDVYCQRCGEPWDLLGITDGDMNYEERERFWKGQDCPQCRGKEAGERPFRAELMRTMREALGDDIDGIAADMDDAESLFGESFWE
ncbi:MAG: hypothetical protein SVM79_06850 [Chloroflexota bacterium]|nr:hypothetical protein [Chloroflexota bacterium]